MPLPTLTLNRSKWVLTVFLLHMPMPMHMPMQTEAGSRRVHQLIKWVVVRGDSSQVVGYKVQDVMSIQRAKGTFPFNVL